MARPLTDGYVPHRAVCPRGESGGTLPIPHAQPLPHTPSLGEPMRPDISLSQGSCQEDRKAIVRRYCQLNIMTCRFITVIRVRINDRSGGGRPEGRHKGVTVPQPANYTCLQGHN